MRIPLLVFVVILGCALLAAPAEVAPPYSPKVASASNEGQAALQGFRLPTGVIGELFAAEPLLANPVAFCFDEKGVCFVAETFRLHQGVTDNRSHMSWLEDDLASRTVADRVAMYRRHLGAKFADYEKEHDRLRRVVDSDGDGQADQATVFADGFRNAADGLGSGVLARKGDVYYACIPDLWLLRDTKGDGKADVRRSLSTGYGIHVAFIGHDSHGLAMGPDGRLYFSIGDRGLNVTTREGKHLFAPDTGAVLRCEPDGSNLEIVATGLRNPQELAFDKYGNLFTGENNSDSGDKARWAHIVEGGDSGWRIGYQYGSAMSDRGPWNAEKLWHLPHEGQPAWIVPPLAHLTNGPSGLCYNPGVTALPEKYADHFFLCDFKGGPANSGVWSFTVRPKGATFELVDPQQFLWSVLATDCDFGPDGGFYVSDWVNGWGLTGKGRLYRFLDAERRKAAAVQEVRKLLAEGFDRRPPAELARLLGHADLRVRQGAQFAFAAKGAGAIAPLAEILRSGKEQLARLHSLWGLGQIGRRTDGGEVVAPLCASAADSDAEVRAQVARVLGEVRADDERINRCLQALLGDSEPRVQFFAAQSVGRRGVSAVGPLLNLLRTNADRDAYLRHAVVMALARGGRLDELLASAGDESAAVRLGVLLALRRRESSEVARFLSDREPRLVAEAARAIHDVPIAEALPRLAALAERPRLSEPVLWRVLNAHFRLGKAPNATAVAALAADDDAPEKVRIEAVKMLGDWTKPGRRDRVTGLTQDLGSRDATLGANALRAQLGGIFAGPDKVRQEAAKVAAKLGIKEVGPALAELAIDAKRPGEVRVEALRALEALKDERLGTIVQKALSDGAAVVRNAARGIQAKREPGELLRSLPEVLEKGELVERQGALELLGELRSSEADALLRTWLERLRVGQVPAEVQLELLTAAARRPALKEPLARYEAARPKDDPLAAYRECLAGGDADEGRRLFFYKTEVSCLRCHKVGGEGGEVGPDLTKLGGQQKRDYLLEAIVAPSRQIAKGYETVTLFLSNGKSVAGIIKAEDAREVRLMNADGHLLTVAKNTIEERQTGKSSMPEDLIGKLTKGELRDLVEFLAGLK